METFTTDIVRWCAGKVTIPPDEAGTGTFPQPGPEVDRSKAAGPPLLRLTGLEFEKLLEEFAEMAESDCIAVSLAVRQTESSPLTMHVCDLLEHQAKKVSKLDVRRTTNVQCPD